ncbi:MAG: hypothetical protein JJE46_08670 [Acidimicrobiia bacterium]|nr:hypothetical protein [Acidimicrobiia bacterium]
MLTTIGLVLVGTLLVFLSYEDRAAAKPPRLGDHWHSYLGVNLCGTWEPPVPQFEGRDGSMAPQPQAGIHSHADYLIHEHPYASDESGSKATLGRYLSYAQTKVTSNSITLWNQWVPNVSYSNGDACPDKKVGELQWKVGRLGRPWPKVARTGNPADYHMENGDIIAIYFLPKGAALEQPPGSDEALHNISDLNGQSAIPNASTSTSVPAPTPDSTPPASDPTPPSTDATTTTAPAGSTTTTTP